jgi:DNA-binding response OmpR family regulator
LDGLSLCRKPRGLQMPIIMLTARAGRRPDRQAGNGRRRLPHKPFNPRELLARINGAAIELPPRRPAPPQRDGLVFQGWRVTAAAGLRNPAGARVA